MTGSKGNSEFCFPETLSEHWRSRGNKTHCFSRGQSLSILLYVTIKYEKLAWLDAYGDCARSKSGSGNRAILPLTKKDNTYVALVSFMLNSRILSLTWRGTAYFVVNDKNYFPTWRQRSKSKLPSPGDPFLASNLPRFQGARPDHVRVESSILSFVRSRELLSFDPSHVTRSPPIEKRWVGRYSAVRQDAVPSQPMHTVYREMGRCKTRLLGLRIGRPLGRWVYKK